MDIVYYIMDQIDHLRNDLITPMTDKILFTSILLLSMFLVYQVYIGQNETDHAREKYNQFRKQMFIYQSLSQDHGGNPSSQGSGNVLNYLETKLEKRSLDENKLARLTPRGKTKSGKRSYLIYLRSAWMREAFQLLRSIEQDRFMGVRSFHLERINPNVRRVHVKYHLVPLRKIPNSFGPATEPDRPTKQKEGPTSKTKSTANDISREDTSWFHSEKNRHKTRRELLKQMD